MPGPAPDPDALRRDRKSDAATWTALPVAYTGAVPEWPLSLGGKLADAEMALWASVWRKPQAAMWARLGLVHQVAAYVRAFVEATNGKGGPSLTTAVLRMEDGLGISVKGMNALRWRITTDEVNQRRTQRPTVVPRESARDRGKKLGGA